jgi:tetratricopeptide (TPR) repeat protein
VEVAVFHHSPGRSRGYGSHPTAESRPWRRRSFLRLAAVGLVLVLCATHGRPRAEVDTGVIRLGQPEGAAPGEATPEGTGAEFREGRKGFNYEAFEARLQALWFQRKALMTEGRVADASKQSDLIRAFCTEEGIRRIEAPAGALIMEARRYLQEGNYERALASLELAEAFDPGRPQVRMARASVFWKSGEGIVPAISECAAALRSQMANAWNHLGLSNTILLLVLFAALLTTAAVAALMAFRYQAPLRHEVEEAFAQRQSELKGVVAGWVVVLLPFLTWIGAAWAAYYWLAITFRFMRRLEKLVAVVLVLSTILAVPVYRISVSLYGIALDPLVRTAAASASGSYDPDRIVRMQELVTSHPDEPLYRFLLAGLYKNGRYLDEAYREYKRLLAKDPAFHPAWINAGNIFYQTGQYAEAGIHYRRAIEAAPRSVLAYYNLSLAQSEAFNFKESEATANKAREIDPKVFDELQSRHVRAGERHSVTDATVSSSLLLRAIVEGQKGLGEVQTSAEGRPSWVEHALQLTRPTSLAGIITLAAMAWIALALRKAPPAQRCLRCGRPFCHLCRSGREGHDYCSQCVHLFVLGDGLAPETKSRKMYEVERYDRVSRRVRRIAGLVLPGSAQVLRGKPVAGCFLLLAWLAVLLGWRPDLFGPLQSVGGIGLRADLLRPGVVPAVYAFDPLAIAAAPLALLIWIAGNTWRHSRHEV